MIVTLSHKDWKQVEEGGVTKTTFYGVKKVWFDPSEGLMSLLLQSGFVYEHELELSWDYAILPEIEDDYLAVDADGQPRGYFRS